MLSLSLWVNLFLLFHPASKAISLIPVPRYAYNSALVCFILYYSYLSDRGWLSVLWDCLFVYAYPFILLKRFAWLFTKNAWLYLKSNTEIPKASLISPTPIAAAVQKPVATQPEKSQQKSSILQFSLRPLLRFTVLWSLLIFSVSYKPLLALISAICVFAAAKALWQLQDVLSDTSSWTRQLRGSFGKQMEEQIAKIASWQEGSDSADAVSSVNVLRVWQVTFAFIEDNKALLSRLTWYAAILITVPFYLYTSYLFGISYLAIAKMQSLQWTLSSAFIDSLYLPFAFTELPHSFAIRGLAGLQAVAISIIGYNVFVKHLSGKFEGLVQAAHELRGPLLAEPVIVKSKLIEDHVAEERARREASSGTTQPN